MISYTCSDIYLYLCRHLLHFRNYYKMKEIIDFLRDISCNNNREWFTANKQRYQEVLSRWHEFCEELIQEVGRFDPDIA